MKQAPVNYVLVLCMSFTFASRAEIGTSCQDADAIFDDPALLQTTVPKATVATTRPNMTEIVERFAQRVGVDSEDIRSSHVGNLMLGILVPSTSNVSDQAGNVSDVLEERQALVQEFLTRLFGGSTADAPKMGSYTAQSSVVYEKMVRVKIYTSKEMFWEHIDEVWAKVRELCSEWGQEGMGFQIGFRLFYVKSNGDHNSSQTDAARMGMDLDMVSEE